ncbi:hypothetical protein [Endozoicomonas sp. ONNA2]|uniref:hypothetical protein n=1 Tax=Endozoicomonas sp. ONNA2 TaxID=2828741 RepID=UPI0021485052|nr:hypothetical protein [Endozoicomonas sp. ONNA2]
MNEPTVGNPLDTLQNAENNAWTCVSWFQKISDAVASKTSRVFGRVVATVVSVVAFIPALAVDLACAAKSLYDRKITIHQTLDPNLLVISKADGHWQRYITDEDVRKTMEEHARFVAENIQDYPYDNPREAYDYLCSNVRRISLVTQEGSNRVKLMHQVKHEASIELYDIGNGRLLAISPDSHQFYDQLMMHTYLEKLGIPTHETKPAVIRWHFEGSPYSKAAYIIPSFKAYTEQNAFVLDTSKAYNTSTVLDDKKLLPDDTEELKAENWDELLNPLVKDIRTLIDNGVSTLGDPIKVILVGKGNKFHSGGSADYEVRAFPFTFSSKHFQHDQFPVKKRLSAKEETKTLRAYIHEVVNMQFNFMARLPQEWETLVDKLTRRHSRRWHFL